MKKPRIKQVKKPWGGFDEFATNQKCTVKVITVNAGGKLSLQAHKRRNELWVALDSGLAAEIMGKKKRMAVGNPVFVPRGAKHRIHGGKRKARFLEVSFGRFSEKDITRFEDKYGRVGKR